MPRKVRLAHNQNQATMQSPGHYPFEAKTVRLWPKTWGYALQELNTTSESVWWNVHIVLATVQRDIRIIWNSHISSLLKIITRCYFFLLPTDNQIIFHDWLLTQGGWFHLSRRGTRNALSQKCSIAPVVRISWANRITIVPSALYISHVLNGSFSHNLWLKRKKEKIGYEINIC